MAGQLEERRLEQNERVERVGKKILRGQETYSRNQKKVSEVGT